MNDELSALAVTIEQLGSAARLSDLAVFMREGQVARIQKIGVALGCLDPGVYLIGTGPYTPSITSLMCDEVVIGRVATILEETSGNPVDVFVNDAVTMTPREVSRVHCAIYRRPGVTRHDYWVIDRGSTCGTYVNRELVPAEAAGDSDGVCLASCELVHGDVLSLGKSGINSFVFVDTRARG